MYMIVSGSGLIQDTVKHKTIYVRMCIYMYMAVYVLSSLSHVDTLVFVCIHDCTDTHDIQGCAYVYICKLVAPNAI